MFDYCPVNPLLNRPAEFSVWQPGKWKSVSFSQAFEGRVCCFDLAHPPDFAKILRSNRVNVFYHNRVHDRISVGAGDVILVLGHSESAAFDIQSCEALRRYISPLVYI